MATQGLLVLSAKASNIYQGLVNNCGQNRERTPKVGVGGTLLFIASMSMDSVAMLAAGQVLEGWMYL